MKVKKRLDVLLTEQGYADSRSKAQAIIMSGLVYVDGQKADKPGVSYPETVSIEVRGAVCPYVSRGGLKLEKALRDFGVNPQGYVCSDSGASTGGFTDCLLQQGAKKVFAIDVGYGQLDYKLRCDDRVINMEKCNIRYIDKNLIQPLDFISVDVSFISLKLILPVAAEMLKEGGRMVCLIKPQFEAGRQQVGKKGIVRDRKVHVQVIENVIKYTIENGLSTEGLTFSPVTGAKGNIEFLIYIEKKPGVVRQDISLSQIEKTVDTSHEELE